MAYVPIHVYWAVTGTAWPLRRLPASLSAAQWRQANWAACLVILGAAALSLALVHPWGRRLPRWMLIGAVSAGAAFAVLHWGAFSAEILLRLTGMVDGAVTPFDWWNLFVFEPWFLGMGVLLTVGVVQNSRGARVPTPEQPSRSPAGLASEALVLIGLLVVLAGVMTFQSLAYTAIGPGLIGTGLIWRSTVTSRRRAERRFGGVQVDPTPQGGVMGLSGTNNTAGVDPADTGEPPSPSPTALADGEGGDRARRSSWLVAGFLAAFLPFNTYWGLGGKRGLAWVLGCDCTLPVVLVWVQEIALLAGIAIVLGRARVWRPPLPDWVLGVGAWAMAVAFGAVALQNLLGDNTLQARLLFAPLAAAMCGLCVITARAPSSGQT